MGTDLYHGGVVYERDAGINPYKLTAGLAERARAAGTRIFEHCAVEGMNTIPGGQEVRIRDGKIRAKQVIVATNGYTGKALPYFRRRLIPISAGVIATEKIGRKKVLEISPKLRMHGGTHRLVFWYRPSPDGERMIFGGRVMDCKKRPKAISSDLLALARRVFPQMEDVKAEYCWHGDVAYTFDHAPHLGEVNGVHYAMGYCGSGITRALYFGRQIAGQILNEAGSETAHDGLAFDGRPFYTGNPWFMPLVLRWHAVADRIAGH
ncbi:MAG: FAD-binding oxidoreductase [Alphaproteobacteria bacterium]|nr:MAG: FAD-binding oxidoreductase [Alphaproteobacteria bacterium]